MRILIVTGTGTGVGKTVTTAAIAALAAARGAKVAVVKPAQTGMAPGEPGDLAEITALSGVTDTHEYARYPDPLAPATAARLSGAPPLRLEFAASAVHALAETRDLVLVEGAGGLLVAFDDSGWTLADLAGALRAPVLVVADPALGTLNQCALTLEALARRDLEPAGIVLGTWPVAPADPDLAMRCNIGDLAALAGQPLAGALPAGAGRLGPRAFLATARASLAPALGGGFDAAAFRAEFSP